VSAPLPPAPVSTRVVVVATVVALLAAVVAVWLTVRLVDRPFVATPAVPVTFAPIPARSAPDAPITPVTLTERPVTGWGPR
jgi:hypothetical protein